MKKLKKALLIITLTALAAACSRDLGFVPEGNYLELSLNFPETGMSEPSRLIHDESDQLYISLTYPDGSIVEAEFERTDSDSTLTVLVENLVPAEGVELYVSLGLADSGVALTEASATIDITEGENAAAGLTLQPIEYEVNLVFLDSTGPALSSSTIYMDDTSDFANYVTFTTDANGEYSLTVSTSDIGNYKFFSMEDMNYYSFDIARSILSLVASHESMEITAKPEIFLDFTVLDPDGNPLPGVDVSLYDWYDYSETIVATSDENGHVFYHSKNDSSLYIDVDMSYFDLYLTHDVYVQGQGAGFYWSDGNVSFLTEDQMMAPGA